MLRKLLLLAALACLPGYSYSEGTNPYFGTTSNAAANGLSWNMNNVFPAPPGLEVNAVIYNYRIRKAINDLVVVNVQNENAQGNGYIFRETDEWRPGSLDGTQISKAVPVIPNIPRQLWGDGSIEVNGPGSVEDANVIYSFRVDPCFDPQSNPGCPGYQLQIPEYEDPEVNFDMSFVQNNQVNPDNIYAQEEDDPKDAKEEDEEDKEMRLEAALAAADTNALFAAAVAQAQMLQAMNLAINMNNYYSANIDGGTYKESVQLTDSKLPTNSRALRNNLAQQILHQQMVESQYKKK